MHLFVSCATGLESLVAKEVTQILGKEPEILTSGVAVDVDSFEDVMKLNLHLRVASRVLLQLFEAPIRVAQDLYKAFRKYSWTTYFHDLESFMIDTPMVHHRAFTNTLYAAQLAKDGLCDSLKAALGDRPSVDVKNPQVRFVVTIRDDVAQIYFDTSLEALHRRGIRGKGHEAPIRETLAAAILLTLGLKPDDVICDPCCGSGTILIEAALIQSNTPPGIFRTKWGFMRHPKFDAKLWLKVQEDAKKTIRPLKEQSFIGIDTDFEALSLVRESIRKMGFEQAFILQEGKFETAQLGKEPTLFIANPPYGVRLQENEDLVPLYRALGEFMKKKGAPQGRGAIFTTYDLSKQIGLKPKQRHVFKNGALDCRLMEFDLFTDRGAEA